MSLLAGLVLLEHFERGQKRLMQIHPQIVYWRNALEARKHQAYELETAELFNRQRLQGAFLIGRDEVQAFAPDQRLLAGDGFSKHDRNKIREKNQ